MTHSPIKDRLRPLLWRQRTGHLWAGLAMCWLIGCIVGLGFMIAGILIGSLSPVVLPVILTTSLVAAGLVWIHHRRTRIDWTGGAHEIEQKHPELDGRLLTALEQEPDSNGHFSYLQQRLFSEVMSHDRLVHWNASFPRSRVGLIKLAHALAFAAFLVASLRLATMQQETLGTTNAAGGVVVTPGDTSIERGNSLVVMVRFNAQVPSGVDLVIRRAGESDQRIPLVRSLEDPMFGGSIPEVSGDLHYAVEYGGRTSRDFKVSVFDFPRMERADANLTYPAYTALRPKHIENTRRVSAVTGTRLDLALQLNKPVASAQLLPKGKEVEPVVIETLSEAPEARLSGFVLAASEHYSLELVDVDGRTNKQAVQFVFSVLSNRTPEMQITAPRGDIRPSALEEVSFGGTVFDDFGVLAYGLAYNIGGQMLETIELGAMVPAGQKHAFEHVIALEELGLQPGDLVSWFFWSEDWGPNGEIRQTMGDLYFAEVRPFDEIFRQGESQFGGSDSQQQQQQGAGAGGGQTARLAELQQQIIQATWKLQRERGVKPPRNQGPPQSFLPASNLNAFLVQSAYRSDAPPNSAHRQLNGFLREMLNSSVSELVGPSHIFAQRAQIQGGDQPVRPVRRATSDSEALFGQDIQIVIDAQREVLVQAEEALARQDDLRQAADWSEAIRQMESAIAQLTRATNSLAALEEALAAQQAAYQRLLRMQEREFSVSQNRSQSGSQSGRQQQRQRQLNQLELTSEENRYETERLAQAPQSAEQQEQLQVMSRLAELARRQQDINERLQELQTVLEAAQGREARERLQRELKRLQDEQRQMLADADELQQRMNSGENQSQFTEQRQQMEQTRESLQRAAESAQEGTVSQALAAGTRAQREMEEMREELRNQSANAFADDMRQMRTEARELTRRQKEIQNQLEDLDGRESRSLSDSKETKELQELLAQQRERLTSLVEQVTQVSQLAEEAEPLMSRSLYETLREFSQDDLGTVKEVQEELLAHGMFPLYQRLKEIAEESGAKTLEMTAEMIKEGILDLAIQTGQRAQQDINDLARGIEGAAEQVLGDDSAALRFAERQLEDLTKQLQDEITRAGEGQSNTQGSASVGMAPDPTNPRSAEANPPAGTLSESSQQGEQYESQSGSPLSVQDQSGQTAQVGSEQPGQSAATPSQNGNQGDTLQRAESGGDASPASLSRRETGGFDFDQLLGGGQSDGERMGPITGEGFGPWSDRLREVEELVEFPDLRNELIRARERARQLRRDYTHEERKPDWARVQLEVVKPLVEVRNEISGELARRQSREVVVPIDRDPVPDRYSELVRRYYEELGRERE